MLQITNLSLGASGLGAGLLALLLPDTKNEELFKDTKEAEEFNKRWRNRRYKPAREGQGT